MSIFGKNTDGSLNGGFANDLYGCRYELTEDGTVSSITARLNRSVSGSDPNVRFALYTDPNAGGGAPNPPVDMVFIAATEAVPVTSTVFGWISADFVSPVVLSAGWYYLMFIGQPVAGSQVQIRYIDTDANSVRTLGFGYVNIWPDPYNADLGFTRNFSIYATYTVTPPVASTLQGLFCRGDEIQVVFSEGVAYRSPDFGTTWYTISGMIGETIGDVGFDHLDPQKSFFGGDHALWVFDYVVDETFYFVEGISISGVVTHIDCDLDSGVSVIGTDESLYKSPDFGVTAYIWKALAVTDVGIGGSDTITTS